MNTIVFDRLPYTSYVQLKPKIINRILDFGYSNAWIDYATRNDINAVARIHAALPHMNKNVEINTCYSHQYENYTIHEVIYYEENTSSGHNYAVILEIPDDYVALQMKLALL